jgi:hypothetical protein
MMVQQAKLVALFVCVLSLFHCADFNETEFECEHAVARLQECCGSVNVDGDFCFYDSSGCEVMNQPVYTLQESLCVQNASCQSIIDANLCEEPEKLGACE